jgi:Domain of unknown function (DUF4920)
MTIRNFLGMGAAIVLFMSACQSGSERTAEGSPNPRAAATTSTLKLGAPMTTAELIPLARLAKDTRGYLDRPIKTEGKVTAVCQAMGCWMEISDASTEVHIKMAGHSFFVPKTASGRQAIVEGRLLAKPGDGECEKEAEQATGKTVKLELEATGVELL